MELDGKSFLNDCVKQAKDYQIIHVHSLYKVIPELRKRYREKKLVLHYHGSEVRRDLKDSVQQQAEEACDSIIGSTKDLERYAGTNMIYIPNPVDTDHFKPERLPSNLENKAFTFETTGADIGWVLQQLKDNNIDINVEVLDRQRTPIQYSEMPSALVRYSVYVDLKFIGNTLLEALSKTALECLACGLRVLDHRLQYIYGLPEENRPEQVSNQVLGIYATI